MENKSTQDKPAPRRVPARVAELEAEIDERDETIRLLNEALSRALDELTAFDRAA
jgi:hypothetical protein